MEKHEHKWELQESYQRVIPNWAYGPNYIYNVYIFVCKNGCGEVKKEKVDL